MLVLEAFFSSPISTLDAPLILVLGELSRKGASEAVEARKAVADVKSPASARMPLTRAF